MKNKNKVIDFNAIRKFCDDIERDIANNTTRFKTTRDKLNEMRQIILPNAKANV